MPLRSSGKMKYSRGGYALFQQRLRQQIESHNNGGAPSTEQILQEHRLFNALLLSAGSHIAKRRNQQSLGSSSASANSSCNNGINGGCPYPYWLYAPNSLLSSHQLTDNSGNTNVLTAATPSDYTTNLTVLGYNFNTSSSSQKVYNRTDGLFQLMCMCGGYDVTNQPFDGACFFIFDSLFSPSNPTQEPPCLHKALWTSSSPGFAKYGQFKSYYNYAQRQWAFYPAVYMETSNSGKQYYNVWFVVDYNTVNWFLNGWNGNKLPVSGLGFTADTTPYTGDMYNIFKYNPGANPNYFMNISGSSNAFSNQFFFVPFTAGSDDNGLLFYDGRKLAYGHNSGGWTDRYNNVNGLSEDSC